MKRPTTWLLSGRGVQLANSVLLSAVVVRRFGLGMVGSFAIGYIAVAFLPHILSLGLNSELPRTKRPMPELLFIAAVVQGAMFLLVTPLLYLYATIMATSHAERPIIFVVAMFGCFTGMFNVALTLRILLREFRSAFFSPLIELVAIVTGGFLAHSGLQMACFALGGKIVAFSFIWPKIPFRRVQLRVVLPTANQGSKYLFLDILSTLSEQLIPFALGISAPREQLGLFRLCQQISSAAETPGWSYVQAKYPELTEGNHSVSKEIARRARTIGMGAAGLCLVGSVPMALFAFHTPVIALMMLVLSAALPWRYVAYVNDWRLRAVGRVAPTLILAIARVAVCAIALELTVRPFGVWAAVWTSALASILFGWLYERAADAGELRRTVNPTGAPAAVKVV
jgi:O-antigen/teichoic acid export membrane protein